MEGAGGGSDLASWEGRGWEGAILLVGVGMGGWGSKEAGSILDGEASLSERGTLDRQA